VDGGCGGAAVEEGEGAGVEAEAVEVAVELAEAGGQRVGVVRAADFDLDGLALLGADGAPGARYGQRTRMSRRPLPTASSGWTEPPLLPSDRCAIRRVPTLTMRCR
jgi:hypothetical protein